MKSSVNRRDFIASATGAAVGITALGTLGTAAAVHRKHVMGLRTNPLERVRVGFVGIGNRGTGAVNRWLALEGIEIVALCDVQPEKVAAAQKLLASKKLPAAKEFTRGPEDWKRLCETADLDLVYTCTPWDLHTPICLEAMRCGKHVATEVPAAITMEECWALVNSAERTRKHCMMLENCCYGENEMMVMNMCRLGVFGELVHGEAAYIHDLREMKFSQAEAAPDPWHLRMARRFNGNVYPTHGLGPVAQYMDINHGDRFERLSSMSSAQRGLTLYAEKRYGPNSPQAKAQYRLGDMNTTIIRTAKGRTIMVQHNQTTPRPYSRLNTIMGTKGTFADYPPRLALEPAAHEWIEGDKLKEYFERYRHPLWKELGEKARKSGGHGGMDYLMDLRLVQCLRSGEPLDQSVYDAATWSSVFPLSCESVAKKGASLEVPDFTRGMWQTVSVL